MERKSHSHSATEGTNSARVWLAYAACVLGYAVIFLFWRTEPVPLEVHIAGVFLWAIALLPLALWYRAGRRNVPIFEMICAAYGLSYGPPIYLVPNQIIIFSEPLRFSWNVTLQSVLLAALGIGLLGAGYYATGAFARRVSLVRANLPMVSHRVSLYANLALLFGLGARVAFSLTNAEQSSYGSVLGLVANQFNIGLALLAYEVFSAPEGKGGRLALLSVCTILGMMIGLSGGMMEGVVLPLVLVLVVRWQVRRRFPYILATCGTFLILILNPIKQEYRERVWFGDYGEKSFVQRMGLWVELAQRHLRGEKDDLGESSSNLQKTMERIDLLHKLVHVKNLTPNDIPYLNGQSYQFMLYAYIPRFIWPEKPTATDATDLVDFRYGFRSPLEENKGTKIAIGQIAEAYANLGVTGLVVVMLVQGILFAFLNHVLNGPQSVGGRAIFLVVMVSFLNGIGTSAVILFGSIIQFSFASAVLMIPFLSHPSGVTSSSQRSRRTRKSKPPAAEPPSPETN